MKIFLTETNFSRLKDSIKKHKAENKEIIFSSEEDEFNRKVIEKLPIDILLINQANRKDFQKQKNSGFNQVMAKIIKKQNITIGINFDEILEADSPKEREELLKIVNIVEQLIQVHSESLKKLGVDLEKEARKIQEKIRKEQGIKLDERIA